ncbi:nicotinate phosphoribosyltransferase [Haloarchaeobius amylolyticus]|uniref:nicotinate phosphoribosyltransferase n=1 Tax=Haloarchaeobius amylolyticus TaxID=1198296 RepID=UPI00227187C5|nr:nicotinate phosphoribosyltransferase [Haloarchaeobius amylolyticus]
MPPTNFGYVTPENLPLFTDRYELTMLQGYHSQGHDPEATFSLFFRDLPDQRGYAIAAGLEQALHYVDTLAFGERALAHLETEGFSEDFLERLREFSFSGEIRAVPEGTPVFPNEPLLEVTAPIFEAQLLETALINQVSFQTLVATKARRMRDVVDRFGEDQSLVDFGSRRAHGTDAGLKAARTAYLGGFTGTSNDAAGEAFDIPVFGTMAHSWVQSFQTEREAFEAFVAEYGEESTLLVDTYDTVAGARLAVEVAEEHGVPLDGVRLDSGDLVALSKEVADIVGDADIFVSSGMDEFKIRDFLTSGGVAAGFGPGTKLVTSADQSSLDAVYKLVAVEEDGEMAPTMKLSPGKVTYPGAKSVRRVTRDGSPVEDVLGVRDEELPGQELLQPVVEGGRIVADLPTLDESRDVALESVRRFPENVRAIEQSESYPVRVSEGLSTTTDELERELESRVDRE